MAALPNADEVASNLPTLSVVKSALYLQRRKLIPALPSIRAEVAFEGEWAQTANGKSFLLAEDGGDNSCSKDSMHLVLGTMSGPLQIIFHSLYRQWSIYIMLLSNIIAHGNSRDVRMHANWNCK